MCYEIIKEINNIHTLLHTQQIIVKIYIKIIKLPISKFRRYSLSIVTNRFISISFRFIFSFFFCSYTDDDAVSSQIKQRYLDRNLSIGSLPCSISLFLSPRIVDQFVIQKERSRSKASGRINKETKKDKKIKKEEIQRKMKKYDNH